MLFYAAHRDAVLAMDNKGVGCAGSDYSEAAVELARSIAGRRGVSGVRWLVDDFLHSSIADRRAWLPVVCLQCAGPTHARAA